ncbi:MAG: hypothetical protein LBV03_08330, partial [Fusobacteriales bacterium]|nr:hypothetical protein [Fusobacteriales bacterium]
MAKAKTEKEDIKKDDEKITADGKELDETKEEKTGTGENTEQEIKEVEKEAEVAKEKVVYIGPNIKGILSNTVFDYMPDLKSYSDYPKLSKLFVKLEDLKKSQVQLKEKSNYLHLIYDQVKEKEIE